MSDPTLLSTSERDALESVCPGWRLDGVHLKRAYEFGDFDEAMEFINQVANVARELDHHPDLANVYNRVQLAVTTHDAGGLTSLDRSFAQRVSALT
ncbi:MAG: 4a-hydroxytetrahydrobiopterin dehydratase [Bradymonadia bacterium]|jgi:4a-hydroxytetrahydrobiopterin dehydratase